jgi:hypothetical protein
MIDHYLASDDYFTVKIFDYDESGNIIYMSCNRSQNAETTATDWKIYKFTYNEQNKIAMREGPLSGSYEDRESLAWRE